jgi:hypothetical protein
MSKRVNNRRGPKMRARFVHHRVDAPSLHREINRVVIDGYDAPSPLHKKPSLLSRVKASLGRLFARNALAR